MKSAFGDGLIELSDKSDENHLIFNGGNIDYAKLLQILNLQSDFLAGNGKAEVVLQKNGREYQLKQIKLQSANECNLKMKQFNDFVIIDNTIKSEFAIMALEDFNSKTSEIVIDFMDNGHANIMISATGRPAKLLPFEFDVGTGELKKVNYSLFNLESTIKLNYDNVKLKN